MEKQTNQNATILVAEDEPGLRGLVTHILQGEGFNVLAAGDGKNALSTAQQFPDEIRLLVTDLVMPKLDGFDLREKFLVDRPGVPILVMSGALDPEIRGEDFFIIRKPFRPEEFLEKVRTILGSDGNYQASLEVAS